MYYYDRPAEIKIQAYSLDEYFPKRDFDVIIMDIEGSEYFALKGMQRILSNSQVLAVEFLPHHLKNVSGVTADEFVNVVQSHFTTLSIPSQKRLVTSSDILSTFSDMYKRNHEEDLVFFLKNR